MSEEKELGKLSMELGMLFAYNTVKKEINTIKTELERKGIETKYFSALDGFIEDSINDVIER